MTGDGVSAGEEKTISTLPQGYGMEVKGTDSWGLLYMVHNATTQDEVVWITYDIDFIPADVDWKPGDYPPEDSFYVWGPPPPDYFTVNHEIAG